MKIENIKVYNFEGAFRGMRNPKDSWAKSDSWFGLDSFESIVDGPLKEIIKEYVEDNNSFSEEQCENWLLSNGIMNQDGEIAEFAFLGPKDLELAQTLISAGSVHRKFLRQIVVSFDLTAPLYIWKEIDTYKVGTVANSCSTMHTLDKYPITIDCFETDDFENIPFLKEYQREDAKSDCDEDFIQMCLIPYLESLRIRYKETKDKKYWKELIRWLPESWLQKRTVTLTYENIIAMCAPDQRRNHKLTEWQWLVNEVFRRLPYGQEFFFLDELKEKSKQEKEKASKVEILNNFFAYFNEKLNEYINSNT